uniref:SH3 domain-containing protein n=1 Tax=Strongyloides papillosus TaxID=174720 RepID=A0A0N5BQ50_STREA
MWKSAQPPVKKQINFTTKIHDWKDRHERDGLTGFAKMVPRNSIIYRAICTYKAQNIGELDLEPNDIIFVVELLPDDYAVGVLLRNGEFGVVPLEKIAKH